MTTLSAILREYGAAKDRFRASLDCPVLVALETLAKPEADLLFGTEVPDRAAQVRVGDPQVFFLRKGQSRNNAFGIGITVGRTENNDVVLDHSSISRFHAYFREGAGPGSAPGQWAVTDADSRNGTWISGKRLDNATAPLSDGESLKFGQVELRFYLPGGFLQMIRGMSGHGD